jgi:hypothetical protein
MATIARDGILYTDGAMHVKPVGDAAITGGSISGVSGVTLVLASSYTAVSGAADTNENILATITIPANTLRAGDSLRVTPSWTVTNNANVKTARVRFSGIGGTIYMTQSLANQTSGASMTVIGIRTTSSQLGGWAAAAIVPSVSGSGLPTSAADTTAATTIVITAQKATAGDTMTLEGYTVELVRA